MINPFIELYRIINVNIKNRSTTVRLAALDIKKEYSGSALGAIWAIAKPLTFIFVYWFAVEIGLRGARNVSGSTPFILWFIPGMFAWFFISDIMLVSGSSLRSHSYLVNKIVFPVATVPIISVLAQFFVHFVLVLGLVLLFWITGFGTQIDYLALVYYLFATFTFGSILAVFLSALTTISRDIGYLLKSISQMLFWLSPVLWPLSNLHGILLKTVKLSPITYLVEGARNAFVYGEGILAGSPRYFIYFWCLMIAFALVTAFIWKKLEKDFADVL